MYRTRSRVYRLSMLVVTALLVLGQLILSPNGRAHQQQPQTEGRSRRVEPAQKGTAPTSPTLIQQPTTPSTKDDKAPQTPDPGGQEVGEEDVIKVDTSLINLQVRVIDRFNRPIDNVRQEDFRVFENGVPQKIEYFNKEEVPIQYGIAVDNSGSLRSQINQVIDAGKEIVNSNKPGDETFIVRFIDSSKIELKQDFTADQNALIDALDEMYIEGGATAVIDAVYVAAEHAAEYKKGNDLNDRRRRALILVTDGEDRNSTYKQEQLFARLREEDVQIYVIGFVNELEKESGFIRKSKRDKAVALLDRLAKETGGRAFYPTSLKELPDIAKEITRDMRTQYVISYSPTNNARDGSYRTVRVAVADASGKDKRIAITRPGYTAPRGGGSMPSKAPAGPPAKPLRGNNR
ncbi:MAG: VWA domain-containing protein [Acidobacteriota bacterium]|nr:VWA domain-containing protein [Acidobacteriota bacterium]